MKLNVLPEFFRFVISINRDASATDTLNDSVLLRVKPDVADRIPSNRPFDTASLVCAELELEPGETIVTDEIVAAARALGWQIADVQEMAEFVLQVVPNHENFMPESLLADFPLNDKSPEGETFVLRLEREGFNRRATFSLTVEDVELLRGQQHVLLIREYGTEE